MANLVRDLNRVKELTLGVEPNDRFALHPSQALAVLATMSRIPTLRIGTLALVSHHTLFSGMKLLSNLDTLVFDCFPKGRRALQDLVALRLPSLRSLKLGLTADDFVAKSGKSWSALRLKHLSLIDFDVNGFVDPSATVQLLPIAIETLESLTLTRFRVNLSSEFVFDFSLLSPVTSSLRTLSVTEPINHAPIFLNIKEFPNLVTATYVAGRKNRSWNVKPYCDADFKAIASHPGIEHLEIDGDRDNIIKLAHFPFESRLNTLTVTSMTECQEEMVEFQRMRPTVKIINRKPWELMRRIVPPEAIDYTEVLLETEPKSETCVRCGLPFAIQEDHDEVCIKRPRPCLLASEGCTFVGHSYAELAAHLEECPRWRTKCFICDRFLEPKDWIPHVTWHDQVLHSKLECRDCPMSSFSCPFSGSHSEIISHLYGSHPICISNHEFPSLSAWSDRLEQIQRAGGDHSEFAVSPQLRSAFDLSLAILIRLIGHDPQLFIKTGIHDPLSPSSQIDQEALLQVQSTNEALLKKISAD